MHHPLFVSLSISFLILLPIWPEAVIAAEGDLAPMTPALDPNVEAKPKAVHTLKGNVEHRISAEKQKKKKPNAKQDLNRKRLLIPQRSTFDQMPKIPGLRADYTFDQSVGIIGIRFMKETGRPAIIEKVFAGTPAARLGLQENDKIVAVDGIPLLGLNREECFDLMIGEPESSVTLSINRDGNFMVKQITRMDFNRIPDLSVRRSYLQAL